MPTPVSKNASQTDKSPILQAFSMYGIANQDGIVFSSLNGIIQNPLNSIFGSIFAPPVTPQPTTENVNQAAAASATVLNSVQAPSQPALTFASTPLRPITPIQRPPIQTSAFSPSTAPSSNQYVVTRPENQCGLSNVTKSRVVGGDIVQIGECYSGNVCPKLE